MKAGRLESTVLSLTRYLLFRMYLWGHMFGISQLLDRSPVLSRVCQTVADFACYCVCVCVPDRPMSRAKFLWVRAMADIGLQWRKVTIWCIYGPVIVPSRTARVKVWRRKHVGKLTLGPSKLGKPRAREGPSVGKPSETSGSRRKRNVGKPSEIRRKRREAVRNVGKLNLSLAGQDGVRANNCQSDCY